MKKYCKACNKLTESSQAKRIKIKKLFFHICLSCGNPYEYGSFSKIAQILVTNNNYRKVSRQIGVTKFGKAGMSTGTYGLYLCTDHWKKTRKRKLKEKSICEVCKEKTAQQVHHLRYNDENGRTILYNEKLKDLLSVCENCHKKLHSI